MSNYLSEIKYLVFFRSYRDNKVIKTKNIILINRVDNNSKRSQVTASPHSRVTAVSTAAQLTGIARGGEQRHAVALKVKVKKTTLKYDNSDE